MTGRSLADDLYTTGLQFTYNLCSYFLNQYINLNFHVFFLSEFLNVSRSPDAERLMLNLLILLIPVLFVS